jgi:hypothetical protein
MQAYPEVVVFIHVDAEKPEPNRILAQEAMVSSYPTFHIYRRDNTQIMPVQKENFVVSFEFLGYSGLPSSSRIAAV